MVSICSRVRKSLIMELILNGHIVFIVGPEFFNYSIYFIYIIFVFSLFIEISYAETY
jgi:hypothetical protein